MENVPSSYGEDAVIGLDFGSSEGEGDQGVAESMESDDGDVERTMEERSGKRGVARKGRRLFVSDGRADDDNGVNLEFENPIVVRIGSDSECDENISKGEGGNVCSSESKVSDSVSDNVEDILNCGSLGDLRLSDPEIEALYVQFLEESGLNAGEGLEEF